METKNELYTKIYDLYEDHRESVKEWSIMPWTKLDTVHCSAYIRDQDSWLLSYTCLYI